MVDFGAEESFAGAAQSVREHHGIEVSFWRVRTATLAHARACAGTVPAGPALAAATLITDRWQHDSSRQNKSGPLDKLTTRQAYWRESRLCLARPQGKCSALCGVTLGGPQVAGELWRQTALRAGLGPATRAHGVGDGAPWVVEQFNAQKRTDGAKVIQKQI